MARRLPIYLLVDTSGSMTGEPIAAVKNGIDMLVADLRCNPQALESAWLSVITFGSEAKQVVPLTEIDSFECPELVAGGKTELGGALKLVCECREKECRKTTKDDNGRLRGYDWLPMVFFFTDEEPQGIGLEESIRAFKSEKWGRVVVVAAKDGSDDTILKRIADVDQFYQANRLGPSGLGSAFRWLDETIDGEVQEPSSPLLVDIAMLFDPVYGEEYRDILRKEAEIILKTNRQIVLRVEYKGISDYLCRDRIVGDMKEYNHAISSINSIVQIDDAKLSDMPPIPPQLIRVDETEIASPANSDAKRESPAYPDHFYFKNDGLSPTIHLRGKEKSGDWFVNPVFRFGFIDPSERGGFGGMLMCCLDLAKSVDAFHVNGAVHCDISPRNVLLDPVAGKSILIGTEHAFDPKIDNPDVLGTKGFIAPEIVATCNNPQGQQVLPNQETDRHSLAVLIYSLLLCRHPLEGAAVWDKNDQTRDDNLTYGEKALFIEHPTDKRNRYDWNWVVADSKKTDLPFLRPWRDLDTLPYKKLGPYLSPLVERAFVDGLHNPSARPTAAEWITAIEKTIPLKLDIPN